MGHSTVQLAGRPTASVVRTAATTCANAHDAGDGVGSLKLYYLSAPTSAPPRTVLRGLMRATTPSRSTTANAGNLVPVACTSCGRPPTATAHVLRAAQFWASHRLKNFLPDLQQAWDLFAPVFSHLPRPPSSWGCYQHLPVGDWYSARVTENFLLADVALEARPPLAYPAAYEGPWRRADR